MELPQPRPFGSESRKPTHNFLSLYSPVEQDPRPPPPQGVYLKTHDFLQPLEQVEKQNNNNDKEKNKTVIKDVGQAAAMVEHIVLPGGIGTYSITANNYINNHNNNNQRIIIPKPETGILFGTAAVQGSIGEIRNIVDENNNNSNSCSSYTAGTSNFTLWEDQSANAIAKKGKTGKENIVINDADESMGGGGGQWPPPFSSNNHNYSNPILGRPLMVGQKNQSFIDMIKSAGKSISGQDGDDYDDEDDNFVVKKEPSSSSHSHPHLNGNFSVKVDAKRSDQKPNTPRSKHSATEQRRRSKINDRFHMLRGLIPHGDQKRDKASFLLEVIEYIQYLQEKVQKYEDSYPGWNQEPPKIMSWGKNQGILPEEFIDLSRVTTSGPPIFAAAANKITNSPNIVESVSKAPDHSMKETDKVPSSIPMLLQQKIGLVSNSLASPLPLRLASESRPCQQLPEAWQARPSCLTECAAGADPEALTIDSGTISISTLYSQGLLNSITQALQSSGVDLSHAAISVQIDLGKRANTTLNSSTTLVKDDVPCSSNQTTTRSRVGDESNQGLKRQKTGRTT
jgi:hypothetical protein